MAPGRLVEVRVSWPGNPRYLKKKNSKILHGELTHRTFLNTEFIRETYNCKLIKFPVSDRTNLLVKVVCNTSHTIENLEH